MATAKKVLTKEEASNYKPTKTKIKKMSTSTKGYMILEIGWAYNDEGYDREGYEIGTEVYLDKAKATDAYNKAVIKDARERNILHYAYENVHNEERMAEFIQKHWDESYEEGDYDFPIPKSATNEEILEFFDITGLKFLELAEVKIK